MPETPEDRLDRALVARGLARSRTLAVKLIEAGAVSVDGQVASKAALQVGQRNHILVASTPAQHYVSRAAFKLLGALDVFDVNPSGRRCLDAGASTGGFTQVLLEREAAHVDAVDVGHGQLADPLRQDSRVRVFEGLNLRNLTLADIDVPVSLVVADVSFISLTLLLGPLAAVTENGGEIIVMVKPQFEVGRDRLARTGVVNSENERRRAVAAVAEAAVAEKLTLTGLSRSPVPGQDGNREYFLWLTKSQGESAQSVEEFLSQAWN